MRLIPITAGDLMPLMAGAVRLDEVGCRAAPSAGGLLEVEPAALNEAGVQDFPRPGLLKGPKVRATLAPDNHLVDGFQVEVGQRSEQRFGADESRGDGDLPEDVHPLECGRRRDTDALPYVGRRLVSAPECEGATGTLRQEQPLMRANSEPGQPGRQPVEREGLGKWVSEIAAEDEPREFIQPGFLRSGAPSEIGPFDRLFQAVGKQFRLAERLRPGWRTTISGRKAGRIAVIFRCTGLPQFAAITAHSGVDGAVAPGYVGGYSHDSVYQISPTESST